MTNTTKTQPVCYCPSDCTCRNPDRLTVCGCVHDDATRTYTIDPVVRESRIDVTAREAFEEAAIAFYTPRR